jgi:hypothetical protein
MNGVAGSMALVLAEAVAGSLVLLWFMPLWGEVKRGFFTLTTSIMAVLALSAWWSASVAAVPGSDDGLLVVRIALAVTIVVALSAALMYAKRQGAARVVGFVSAVASVSLLVAMAQTGRQSFVLGLFQLLAGAAFLGSVTVGLLLGHWYLTDRGLSRGPINRATDVMIAAVLVEGVAIISGGFEGVDTSTVVNPLLGAGGLAPWIALGMVFTTLVTAVLARLALRGERASAVQSATGFYYLAVVTAFTAEVAVKTRFLP